MSSRDAPPHVQSLAVRMTGVGRTYATPPEPEVHEAVCRWCYEPWPCEASAVAPMTPSTARLAELVRGLPRDRGDDSWDTVARADVLALLDPQP